MKNTVKQTSIWLFLILFTALLFRLVNLPDRFHFSGEIGENLLAIKDYILNRRLPLTGPPTSHPWLFFGPFYYWLMIPLILIAQFNPLVVAYSGALLGTIIVALNFIVLRRIINLKVALISSFLLSLSPLFIKFSQEARFYFLVVALFYLLLSALFSFWQGKKKMFWLGLIFGLMLNFHYSALLLAPALGVIGYLKRKLLNFKDYFLAAAGLLFTFIPLLVFDLKNNLVMLQHLTIWLPYRILGFVGIIPQNQATVETISTSLNSIIRVIGESLSVDYPLWLIITAAFVGYLYWSIKNKIIRPSTFPENFLVLALIFSTGGIIIHGSAPVHYLLSVLPIPVILISTAIARFLAGRLAYWLIVVIVLLNLNYYQQLIFNKPPKVNINTAFVAYSLQQKITQAILTDAQGKNFTLERKGAYDHFSGYYAQNYHYLLWLGGNQPQEKSSLKYIIIEDTIKIPENLEDQIFWIEQIAVLKL